MPALSFGENSGLSSFDDARLSRVESALPVSRAGGVLYSSSGLAVPSSSSVLASGKISPSTGIATTGNTFPFSVQGQFGFSWDGSVLSIYWDGTNGSQPLVVRRSDGSQFSIPKGSIRISSLAASTQYAFAPFLAVSQPQRVSFVVGDSGSPRYALSPSAPAVTLAQASQTQRLTTNERLTDSFIYFTTGDSGTATSGGGTGGTSPYPGCAARGTEMLTEYGWMNNEDVFAKRPRIMGRDGLEDIVSLKWHREIGYSVTVDGCANFLCSVSHTVIPEGSENYTAIRNVPRGTKILTQDGYKPILSMEPCGEIEVLRVSLSGPSHQYCLAGGLWSHNAKAPDIPDGPP